MPVACSSTRIILQRNIIIWRHLLTLTVHKVQFHTSRLPNRRTEQWEQTHCLIRAEVSALERWNTKAKFPLPKSVIPHPLPVAISFYFLCSHVAFPTQERCHFHYSNGKKSVVSASLKVKRNFRKSFQVTIHLSSLSGTFPVHSSLRKLKNSPLPGFLQLLHCPKKKEKQNLNCTMRWSTTIYDVEKIVSNRLSWLKLYLEMLHN